MNSNAIEDNKVRIVAVTPAAGPVPLAFARLVGALRQAGAEVTPLPVPRKSPATPKEGLPGLSELKAGLQAFADQVVSTIRGDDDAGWLASHLGAVEGKVDGVVAITPQVAEKVFPVVGKLWPQAVRVAVEGDFHVDPK